MPGMRLLSILAALAVAAVGLVVTPARAADPYGTTGCDGVRPGAYAEDAMSNVYTIGFLYKGVKGKDKANYFVTVGDLILPAPGTRVWNGSSGPAVRDINGKKIGNFTYAYRVDTPNADTFGLVRIDKNVKFNAQVCHFGGPTGLFTDLPVTPFAVQFYGQGLPFVLTVPARSGMGYGANDPAQAAVVGPAGLFAPLGDAGGPVLVDGKALGIFTGGVGIGTASGFIVSRLRPAIARVEQRTKIKLTLQTARAL